MRSAFIIMIDYGKGLEAYPNGPELTRRGMIDLIVKKEVDIEDIAWIWFVCDWQDGSQIITDDITEEVKAEALSMIVTEPEDVDRQAQAWDRKRDLMKESV